MRMYMKKSEGFASPAASDLSQISSLLHSTQTLAHPTCQQLRWKLIPASQLILTAAILAVIGLSETSSVDRGGNFCH